MYHRYFLYSRNFINYPTFTHKKMLSPLSSILILLACCCCHLTSADMPICSNPAFYQTNNPVCDINGKYCCECVSFVKRCTGDNGRSTSQWKKGKKVRGNSIAAGTAIATFLGNGGTTFQSGNGHAAIFISQDSKGINVWDQFHKRDGSCKTVAPRYLPFGNPSGSSNDGDKFYVIG